MRKKLTKLLILGVFCAIGLIGCAEKPEEKEVDGVEFAVGEAEKNIDKIINEEDDSSVRDESKECNVSFGEGNNVLNIAAIIDEIDYASVEALEVKPLSLDLDKEAIQKTFFEGEEVEELDDIEPYDEELFLESLTDPEAEIACITPKTSIEHAFHLANLDGSISFTRYCDSGITFVNDKLVTEYEKIANKTEQIQLEQDVSDLYSMETAWNDLKKTLSVMGIDDLKSESRSGYTDGETAFYEIEFSIPINQMPLIDIGVSKTLMDVSVYGFAVVGNKGISDIQIDNMLWENVNASDVKVMSANQMLEVAKQYVENGDIECSPNITYDHVQLCYMIQSDDWKNFHLTPVWRIYISSNKWMFDASVSSIWENEDRWLSNEIRIDAVTGDLLAS